MVERGPAIVEVLESRKEEEEMSWFLGVRPWPLLLLECTWRVTAAMRHAWQSTVVLQLWLRSMVTAMIPASSSLMRCYCSWCCSCSMLLLRRWVCCFDGFATAMDLQAMVREVASISMASDAAGTQREWERNARWESRRRLGRWGEEKDNGEDRMFDGLAVW